MSKQVMSILSAKDKKIMTLFPEKKAIKEAVAKAQDLASGVTVGQKVELNGEEVTVTDVKAQDVAVEPKTAGPEANKDVKPLKLNRKTRRYLQRRSRPMRKAEVREKAELPRYTNDKFQFIGPGKLRKSTMNVTAEAKVEQMETAANEQD
jgi:hypothetical protein